MTVAATLGAPGWLTRERAQLVLGLLAFLLVWELSARALEGTFILAGPLAVTAYIAEHWGLHWRALQVTLLSATLGFVFGNLAAIALAGLAILLPRLEGPIAAIALMIFCLPLVATGPILRALYGPGIGPQVTLSAMACYYTTFVPLLVGLRAAPQAWFDLVASYGRGAPAKLYYVRARAGIPYLVAGLQIAAPAAFLGAMIGEFTGAERGMGVLAIRALRGLDVDATWALATIAGLVAILVYLAVGAAGRAIAPDRPAILLAAPPQGPRRGAGGTLLVAALTLVFVIVAWQLVLDGLGLNAFFAKRPGDVWAFLVTAPDAGAHRAALLAALGETISYTIPGYLAGLALGAGLAAAFVVWPALAGTALPVAVALRSIPIVTTAPLIVLALGRGVGGIVTIVAVMIFFPTLVACIQGLRQAPGQVLDVFDSYGAGRWRRLVTAQLPAMLPALFAAARMAVPAAVLAVTVAEWLATGTGIGNLMALTPPTSNYAMLWSAMVLLTAVSFAAYSAVGALERRVLAVYAPEQVAR